MSPIYIAPFGQRPFADDGVEPGEAISAFRGHLREQRPDAWRAVGAGLHGSTVGALRALTAPPVRPLELLGTSDGGWTPPADNDSETSS